MFTLCEPSGDACAWKDDRTLVDRTTRDRFDVFVSDDIVCYPPPGEEPVASPIAEFRTASETATTACTQPAILETNGWPAKTDLADRSASTAVPRPLQAPTRRLQQSNFSNRRQMGGVKQINRYFSRRQFG
jgi:hypothetical protein